jgi:hypothetical protein
MLKEMPELRAPEKSRIGIEIKPKVRYPDQTEAAIVHPVNVLPANHLLDRARAIRVVSLDHVRHFLAPDFGSYRNWKLDIWVAVPKGN